MKYEGRRTKSGCVVYVIDNDGERHNLPKRLDLIRHSPTGFEWSYDGSGPAQLAVALLADHAKRAPGDHALMREIGRPMTTEGPEPTGDMLALAAHQAFKRAVVSGLPKDRWDLTTAEIHNALDKLAREREAQRDGASP